MDRQGNNHSINEVRNYQTGKVLASFQENVKWMPRSNKMYFVQKNSESAIEANGNAVAGSALSYETESSSQQLVTVNPLTMEREVLATNIPEGFFQFTPDEKSLIYTVTTEGRKKDAQVYDIKEPDDRQPGWRNRSNLAKYDLASGISSLSPSVITTSISMISLPIPAICLSERVRTVSPSDQLP